jgi:hypothetical protein
MSEASPHDLIELGDVLKTPARAMDGNETSALFDKGLQIFPVGRIDLRMIRIEEDGVVVREKPGIAEGGLGSRDVVEPDRVAPQCIHEHRVIEIRTMVLRLVPDEEHADGAFIGSGLRRRRQA